jgi:hypothetical protein
VDDEDVIARVHADADRRSEHPVVRQRLGPHRIDLEARRLHGLQPDLRDECPLPDPEGGKGGDEGSSDGEGTPTGHRLLRWGELAPALSRRPA